MAMAFDGGRGARVLVVDDEPKIREVVGSYLRREGYRVRLVGTGGAAFEATLEERPDIVVLDLMLPDLDGRIVAQELRRCMDVPIIMLTALSAEEDRVAGLRLGADDYLVKPFSVRELSARIATVLRRAGVRNDRLRFDGGRLVVERRLRQVFLAGDRLALTRTQFDLLLALIDARGLALSREQLLAHARGGDADTEERTIDAHVKNVRRRLGDDSRQPRVIVTMPGIGYRFGLTPDA